MLSFGGAIGCFKSSDGEMCVYHLLHSLHCYNVGVSLAAHVGTVTMWVNRFLLTEIVSF